MIDKDEILRTKSPDPEKIKCRTCRHKTPSVKIGDRVVERFTFGNCDAYPYPGVKPDKVLWEGADCPSYEPEVES